MGWMDPLLFNGITKIKANSPSNNVPVTSSTGMEGVGVEMICWPITVGEIYLGWMNYGQVS